MAIALYFDVHVDHAIAAQLRIRQVDVLTAQEDSADRLSDELLLERASQLSRPIVTHDIHSAFSVGDRIAFLHQGVFEWVGSMDAARDTDNPRLRDFLKASAVTAAQPSK